MFGMFGIDQAQSDIGIFITRASYSQFARISLIYNQNLYMKGTVGKDSGWPL